MKKKNMSKSRDRPASHLSQREGSDDESCGSDDGGFVTVVKSKKKSKKGKTQGKTYHCKGGTR